VAMKSEQALFNFTQARRTKHSRYMENNYLSTIKDIRESLVDSKTKAVTMLWYPEKPGTASRNVSWDSLQSLRHTPSSPPPQNRECEKESKELSTAKLFLQNKSSPEHVQVSNSMNKLPVWKYPQYTTDFIAWRFSVPKL
jgi:hypothetical protein